MVENSRFPPLLLWGVKRVLKRVPVTNEAQVQDIFPLVAEIWREVFTEMIGQEQVERMLQEYQSPEAILADIAKGVQYFALESAAGECVGYTAYSLSEPTILYISKLYLHKSVRGQGLMRENFRWYDKLAAASGRRQQLRVNQNNTNAIAVYRHQGFEIVGEETVEIAPGLWMNDYILEK